MIEHTNVPIVVSPKTMTGAGFDSHDIDQFVSWCSVTGSRVAQDAILSAISECRERLEEETNPSQVVFLQGQIRSYKNVVDMLINGPTIVGGEQKSVDAVVRYTDERNTKNVLYRRRHDIRQSSDNEDETPTY